MNPFFPETPPLFVREAFAGHPRYPFSGRTPEGISYSNPPRTKSLYVRFLLFEFDAKIPCISLRFEPTREEHTRILVTALRTDPRLSLQPRFDVQILFARIDVRILRTTFRYPSHPYRTCQHGPPKQFGLRSEGQGLKSNGDLHNSQIRFVRGSARHAAMGNLQARL